MSILNRPFLTVNRTSTMHGILNILAILLLCAVGLAANTPTPDSIHEVTQKSPHNVLQWKTVMDGLDVSTLDADDINWSGNSEIAVLRIDALSWTFKPFSFRTVPKRPRLSAREWVQQTGASVVINAGQYDTSFDHLGWLISDKANLGSRQHPIWKGLLAADPIPSQNATGITILDLKYTHYSLSTFPYRQAVQTLMLFDRTGAIRVNKSSKRARRCVVASGHDGNLYLFVTRGECTLWDLAIYLQKFFPDLREAISMDGGAQAQLSVKTDTLELNIPNYQIALPAVVGFIPNPKKDTEPTSTNP